MCVQGVSCVHSQRAGCGKIMRRRVISRLSSSHSVEITLQHGTAKLTLTLKHKIEFFRNHFNQPNRNQPTETL